MFRRTAYKTTCFKDLGPYVTDVFQKGLKRSYKARKNKILKRDNNFGSGALWKFSQTVSSARFGAVTHPGAKEEKKIY